MKQCILEPRVDCRLGSRVDLGIKATTSKVYKLVKEQIPIGVISGANFGDQILSGGFETNMDIIAAVNSIYIFLWVVCPKLNVLRPNSQKIY
mgnify:CR=1 FL=1